MPGHTWGRAAGTGGGPTELWNGGAWCRQSCCNAVALERTRVLTWRDVCTGSILSCLLMEEDPRPGSLLVFWVQTAENVGVNILLIKSRITSWMTGPLIPLVPPPSYTVPKFLGKPHPQPGECGGPARPLLEGSQGQASTWMCRMWDRTWEPGLEKWNSPERRAGLLSCV